MQNPIIFIFDNIKHSCILLFISFIKWLNIYKMNTHNFFDKYYNEYPIIKTSFQSYENCKYEIDKLIYDYKIENPRLWCSIISINNNVLKENTIKLEENYLQEDTINKFISLMQNTNNDEINKNSIIIAKTENMRICKKLSDIHLTNENTQKYFLSIEYRHPKMNNPIEIHLLPEYYITNNEILSSEFVLRYLEYQKQPFVFDKDYSLNIMDYKLNMITLKNNEFIQLLNNDYLIK
jgi:hypothetical protein